MRIQGWRWHFLVRFVVLSRCCLWHQWCVEVFNKKKRKPCANILVISTWDVIVPFLGTADNNYRAVNTSAGVGWGMDVHRRTDVHMDMPDIGSALQTLMSTFLQLLNWCGQTVLILKIVWWGIVLEKQLRSTIYNNLMQYFLLLWPQNNAGIHQFWRNCLNYQKL